MKQTAIEATIETTCLLLIAAQVAHPLNEATIYFLS